MLVRLVCSYAVIGTLCGQIDVFCWRKYTAGLALQIRKDEAEMKMRRRRGVVIVRGACIVYSSWGGVANRLSLAAAEANAGLEAIAQ